VVKRPCHEKRKRRSRKQNASAPGGSDLDGEGERLLSAIREKKKEKKKQKKDLRREGRIPSLWKTSIRGKEMNGEG